MTMTMTMTMTNLGQIIYNVMNTPALVVCGCPPPALTAAGPPVADVFLAAHMALARLNMSVDALMRADVTWLCMMHDTQNERQ